MKSLRSLLAGLVCSTALVVAGPVAPPPAVTEFPGTTPSRTSFPKPAAGTAQYSIGDPTDEEQLYLELLNRARANPTAEGMRLATAANLDADTLAAYQFFHVDLVQLKSDLAAFPPLPPLALEPRLTQAARGHTQWMLANGIQAHEETLPAGSTTVVNSTGTRLTGVGYQYSSAGESVFAFADSVPNGHAGFEVDWGNGPGGVQNPPGHRLNNHSASFREIGIGVLDGHNTVTNINAGVTNIGNVGPQLVTFDFGSRPGAQPLLTGVAYYDLNGNQFYDPGEGIGGLNVTIAGSDNFAVTANSGGYAVPTVDGTQVVTFSGPNFPGVSRSVEVSGGNNLKADLALTYVPPVIGGTVLASLGASTPYAAMPVPGATAYLWEYARRSAFTTVLGAEAGAGDFTASIGPGYSVISTDSHRTGTASYHLAHTNSSDQVLTLNTRLRATATSQMNFATRLAAATTNEVARAQISTNGGVSWVTVWEQMGRTNNSGATIENTFTQRSVSLAAFADQEVNVRFAYVVVKSAQTAFFNFTTSLYGFFFDDLSFTGVEQLSMVSSTTVTPPAFAFAPPSAGDYALHVSPQIGGRSFAFGPWFFVSTTGGVPPSVALTVLTNGPGWVSVSPPGGIYSPGTTVTLTAMPSFTMSFQGWSGGASGSQNPLSLVLNANTTVTGNFTINHTLATTAVGQGIISASPQKALYADGEVVSLTAIPDPGWVFGNWAGDLGGSLNPTNLVMKASKSVTAVFLPTYTLTTAASGQGTVSVLPAKSVYLSNDVVSVTATPAPGWVFTGWSGDLSGSVNPSNLVLNANKSVTAIFAPTFTLTTATTGEGMLTALPLKDAYASNEVVTFSAVPAPGWAFTGWSGSLDGSLNPTSLVINGNKAVTANFTPTFTVTAGVTGLGTVLVAPLKLVYLSNDVVTVTATPAPGSVFAGWSGDLGGALNPTNLVVNGNKSVTANFSLPTAMTVEAGAIVLGPNGNLRVDFTVTGGTPVLLSLQKANDPTGPYSPLAATLTTNSPGHFSFKQIVPSGTSGYLRVEAQ
ncbi:MAG TPA: hypothetical protein VMB21_08090 [Candidatus Limnocylindria bacterium]|jgi:hypothetical protein|nr:hypothetical protein [Candidatus Limnocylindria bacterium]